MLLSPILNLCTVTIALYLTSHLLADFSLEKNKGFLFSILFITLSNFLLATVLPLILVLLLFPGQMLIFGVAISSLSMILMPIAMFSAFFIVNLLCLKMADRFTNGFFYNKRSSLITAAVIRHHYRVSFRLHYNCFNKDINSG